MSPSRDSGYHAGVSNDDPNDGGKKPLDVVVGIGQTKDGEGVHVVRLRDDEQRERVIEVGEMRRAQPDTAIAPSSEIVKLSPRGDGPAFDVEVVVPRRALSGPPQCANDAYRANWSATFGDDDLN